MNKKYTDQQLLDLASKIDIHKIKDGIAYWDLVKQIPDLVDEILYLRQELYIKTIKGEWNEQ